MEPVLKNIEPLHFISITRDGVFISNNFRRTNVHIMNHKIIKQDRIEDSGSALYIWRMPLVFLFRWRYQDNNCASVSEPVANTQKMLSAEAMLAVGRDQIPATATPS